MYTRSGLTGQVWPWPVAVPCLKRAHPSQRGASWGLLRGTYREHVTAQQVAKELGISDQSLWAWRLKLGISVAEVQRTIVASEHDTH